MTTNVLPEILKKISYTLNQLERKNVSYDLHGTLSNVKVHFKQLVQTVACSDDCPSGAHVTLFVCEDVDNFGCSGCKRGQVARFCAILEDDLACLSHEVGHA